MGLTVKQWTSGGWYYVVETGEKDGRPYERCLSQHTTRKAAEKALKNAPTTADRPTEERLTMDDCIPGWSDPFEGEDVPTTEEFAVQPMCAVCDVRPALQYPQEKGILICPVCFKQEEFATTLRALVRAAEYELAARDLLAVEALLSDIRRRLEEFAGSDGAFPPTATEETFSTFPFHPGERVTVDPLPARMIGGGHAIVVKCDEERRACLVEFPGEERHWIGWYYLSAGWR